MKHMFALLGVMSILAFGASPAKAGPISVCDNLSNNLVKNCGFEANSAQVPTDWTADAAYLAFGGDTVITNSAHSGNNALQFGPFDASGPAGISQTIADVNGSNYDVTFYVQWGFVDDPTSADPNAFVKALLNGVTRLTIDENDNPPPQDGYAQYTYSFTGTGSDTIKFLAQTNPSEWFLDDVSVVGPAPTNNVPEPASLALIGIGLLGLAAFRRRR